MDSDIFLPGNRVVLDTPLVLFPRVTTEFRGFCKGSYLILDTPMHEGRSLELEVGMKCVLRLMHQAQVYGFAAEVLGRTFLPFPLLFLSYPREVETISLRKGKLYAVMLDAVFCRQAAGEGQGLILNLSEGGALLETERPLEVGTELALSWDLPEHGRLQDLPARVLSCLVRGRSCWVELSFDQPKHPGYHILRKYLHYLETRQLEDALLRLSP